AVSLVVALQRVLGRVADQAPRVAYLVHHLVAAVDTGGAADTLVLEALADVDAGRAHLHADAAVHAVAEAFGLVVDAASARAARLATFLIVGDDQRIGIEHHALEAGVRAHVLAHLLAHPTGVAVGGETVE